MNKKKVFISYSSKDEEYVFKIIKELQIQKISCWISAVECKSKPDSKDFRHQILEGIDNSDFVLLFLSKNSLESKWVDQEIATAFEDDKSIIIIDMDGVDLKNSNLRLHLQTQQRISINDDNFFELLIGNLRGPNWIDNSLLTQNSKLILGIDVGALTIGLQLFSFSDTTSEHFNYKELVQLKIFEHSTMGHEKELIDSIHEIIELYLNSANISVNMLDSIGLGLPGQVNIKTGVLLFSPGLRIHDLYIVDELEDFYNIPVAIDNDVNCSSIAELHFGIGKNDIVSFLCVYVGAGIGSGIVVNGKVYRGVTYASGEIGHMKIDFANSQNTMKCGCGQDGCFENFASTGYINEKARHIIHSLRDRNIESAIAKKDPNTFSVRTLVEVIQEEKINNNKDDFYATEIATDVARNLAVGISNAVHLLNPEAIVLGGGVIRALGDYAFFTRELRKHFKDITLDALNPHGMAILKSKILNAQVLGAACLSYEKLKDSE